MMYKGDLCRVYYRADLVCFESVIVEVKALAGARASRIRRRPSTT